jgi:hypothetical protein
VNISVLTKKKAAQMQIKAFVPHRFLCGRITSSGFQ